MACICSDTFSSKRQNLSTHDPVNLMAVLMDDCRFPLKLSIIYVVNLASFYWSLIICGSKSSFEAAVRPSAYSGSRAHIWRNEYELQLILTQLHVLLMQFGVTEDSPGSTSDRAPAESGSSRGQRGAVRRAFERGPDADEKMNIETSITSFKQCRKLLTHRSAASVWSRDVARPCSIIVTGFHVLPSNMTLKGHYWSTVEMPEVFVSRLGISGSELVWEGFLNTK